MTFDDLKVNFVDSVAHTCDFEEEDFPRLMVLLVRCAAEERISLVDLIRMAISAGDDTSDQVSRREARTGDVSSAN